MILLSEKECEESQPTDPDRGSLTTYRLLGKQGLGGGLSSARLVFALFLVLFYIFMER